MAAEPVKNLLTIGNIDVAAFEPVVGSPVCIRVQLEEDGVMVELFHCLGRVESVTARHIEVLAESSGQDMPLAFHGVLVRLEKTETFPATYRSAIFWDGMLVARDPRPSLKSDPFGILIAELAFPGVFGGELPLPWPTLGAEEHGASAETKKGGR